MYLRELKINGFKSFAERTPLRLDAGITCIVGPNGCGKSNIVDAIRWVLGEQSAKALRGGKMQDVIFQGTDKRKPLPSCEVSLVFADCEAELGTQFNEVEISRRVDREGSGDYFINGKRCRLRDIQQLFMDTGIGRSGYSFMMQGQIDQILSSNPQERRTIFEEAAGITKYKAQRKEALNKLALTEQNLARITDVIEQMTRQINSLRRQASKALRFKRLKHRLTHLDLARLTYLYGKRQAVIQEFAEKAAGLRSTVDEDEGALRKLESSLAEHKAARTEAIEAVQRLQQSVFDLRSSKESAQSQIDFAEVRQKDIAERRQVAEEDVQRLQEQVDALADKQRDVEQEKAEAMAQVSGSDEQFQGRQKAFEELSRQLGAIERQASTRKQELLVREGSLSRFRSQVTTAEVDLKSYEVKHASLGDSLYQAKEQAAAFEKQLEELQAARSQREAQLKQADEAVEAAKEAVAAQRKAFRDKQAEIQEADRTVAKLSARLGTLQDMQARFEGFSAGAKAILQGKLDAQLESASSEPLSAVLEADPRYTPALETLLGASAEAIVLDERVDRVAPVLRALDEQNLGRACLQVSVAERQYDLGGITRPDWLVPVSQAVQARNEAQTKLVKNFFAGCYFCDELERFLEFWDAHYAFNFLFVATNHDELVSHRGLVYGGRRRQSENSFIQRSQQIETLQHELAEANEHLTSLNEQVLGLNQHIEQAEQELEQKRARSTELGQEVSSLKSEIRTTEQALQRSQREVNEQQRQLEQMKASREHATQKLTKTRADLAEAEAAVATLREQLEGDEQAAGQLQQQRDAHRDDLAEARLKLAEHKQRLELFDRGVHEAEAQRRDLQQRLNRRQQEIADLVSQSEELSGNREENARNLAELEQTLEAVAKSLAEAKTKASELEQGLNEAEEQLKQRRNVLSTRQKTLNSYEVRLAEERSQANFILEKVQGDYDRDVTQIRWRQQLWLADEEFETRVRLDDLGDEDEDVDLQPKVKHDRGDPTPDDLRAMDQTDWVAVGKEVEDLRRRIGSLGAINLVAIDEYAELKEQYDFRKTQSDDIWRAKEELVKTIDEINETSQQLFAETFETVRQNFKYTFEKLFGGGTGDLELIAAEDVLDSGIEIIARPPGTKLRNLSLLSGGQRTMTAVGLLFAIYMVKPSPFAVLDELDAPLDDINVGRFCDIVKEFVKYSQFLIVTHNKRTMAVADAIFGVTMQERGVTRMVSMKFDHTQGEAETGAVVG